MTHEQPTTHRLSRRERIRQQTRDEILDAAARAFASTGYRSSTMSAIAHDAGLTAAALYNYFGSKEDIARALADRIFHDLVAVLGVPTPSTGTTLERVEARVSGLLTWVEHHRDEFRAIFALQFTGANLSQGTKDDQGLMVLHDIMAAWLAEPWARAAFPAWSPDDLACALRGMCDGFFRRWVIRDEGSIAATAPMIARLFVRGASGGPDDA